MARSPAGLEVATRPPDVPWFLRSRARLFATLLVVLALPFAVFSADVALNARKSLEEQASRQNTAAARLGAEAVEAHFEGLSRYMEAYARSPDLAAAIEAQDAQAVRAHLKDLIQGNRRNLDRVFIADPNGVERYDWPVDPTVIGKSFAFRDWYKGVSRGRDTYVSEVYLRAATPKRYVVAIAVPIVGSGDAILGYLVAQYTIQALSQRLAEIKPAEAGTITLIDQNGHLALEPKNQDAEPQDLSQHPLIQQMLNGGEESLIAEDPRSHVWSLLSFARAPSIRWIVLAQQPAAAVHAPAKALQNSILLLSLLFLGGMLGLGFVWLNVVRRHNIALLELQRQKDLLSGMVIHDLRNPLAAAIGSIDLVRAHSQEMDPLVREDVTRAAQSAKRVRDLLNTLLDIMRMEEGVLAPKLLRQDLVALVRSKVDEYRPLAQAASLILREVLPEQPVEANVDADLFGRVIDNLITNAIKHTPRGGQVAVELAGEPEKNRVILIVSDTGEGIPPEAVPRLFQKFSRVAGQEMERPHDVGLGLVFCRMATELHGGTIQAESTSGRGTVFRVVLPMPRT